jgi:Fe-S-cluster-containing hydrogenase component 2
MHAVRTLRLCTKDCVCLFVCPTGATDTEDGQVDASRCLDGCRRCVDACPSHALSLVLDDYPRLPAKQAEVAARLLALLDRKASEEEAAAGIAARAPSPGAALVAKALAKSLRIMAEDAAREADFLVPQGTAARALLESVLAEHPTVDGRRFPEQELRELSRLLAR